MRALGIDYGTERIGLSLSDPSGLIAQAHSVLQKLTDKEAISTIVQLVHTEQVETAVLGLPRNMNGSEGEWTKKVRQFGHLLEQNLSIPLVYIDERLTTVAAERTLLEANISRKRRRQVVDALAATLLLQQYLDFRSRNV
ncbi:Holliday junction resolvase RuvX [Alicyclobacillus sp. TC]|uniref:Putative pre-16S rRNA nuclease n=2 Tax=Alicyclobacillus tolerans TaxID=90970 RepID=A0A1M6K040_9BACL|nr:MULTISPECIES: Holliday junction resolvase RuvX [Alicyclobacillus]MDP9727345.1 putative Holliday junction resolvase [Alicyclobacillus tengchongensis]QRF23087.1 Holliday junction resolvase RuvX [Alicyclobacillus sp. TC]SHJ52336.1 putative holliday junction resolvase [Alicyclobacillus montanus]